MNAPFYNLLWVAGRGKLPPEIAGIVHSILGGILREHLTTFLSFGCFHSVGIIPLRKCPFSHSWGVAGRGRLHLKLLALVIPNSWNPMEDFTLF